MAPRNASTPTAAARAAHPRLAFNADLAALAIALALAVLVRFGLVPAVRW